MNKPTDDDEKPEHAAEAISDALDFLSTEADAAGLSDVSELIQQASEKSRAYATAASSPAADDNITWLDEARRPREVAVRRRWSRYWPRYMPLAAAGAVAAIAFTLQLSPGPAYEEHFRTAVGQYDNIQLPDGSRIQLNTDSELTVVYGAGGRHVDLTRGEAYFDVTPAPERPFSVDAGAGSVRAVGTAFNVYVRSDAVEVTVTEGTVAVLPDEREAAGDPPTLVDEGQQLEYRDTTGPIADVDSEEIARKLAWQDGMLDLRMRPLAEIIAEANRYMSTQVTVDPAVEDIVMSATLKAGDLGALLSLIEASETLVAHRTGAGQIEITAATAPNQ